MQEDGVITSLCMNKVFSAFKKKEKKRKTTMARKAIKWKRVIRKGKADPVRFHREETHKRWLWQRKKYARGSDVGDRRQVVDS